jgi:chemotaxis signal transduction protein
LQNGAAQALVIDSPIEQVLINNAHSKGIKFVLGHTKPFRMKRVPGLNVLSTREIVKTAGTSTIPPAPKPIIKKVATKKEVKK